MRPRRTGPLAVTGTRLLIANHEAVVNLAIISPAKATIVFIEKSTSLWTRFTDARSALTTNTTRKAIVARLFRSNEHWKPVK